MLKSLFIQIIVVYLQRVFHSIRFKEEGDAAASHFSFYGERVLSIRINDNAKVYQIIICLEPI